jgi:hypothetical protein
MVIYLADEALRLRIAVIIEVYSSRSLEKPDGSIALNGDCEE